jgi:ribose-phosphate pyrophosphokinase
MADPRTLQSNEILLLSTARAEYFANCIHQHLLESHHQIHPLKIKRSTFADGEHYYCLDVQSNFELLGKCAIYVCPLTSDEDILEVVRVGHTLVQYGVRRRIFIIPFLAYSTMERAVHPGEVVTAKCTIQMLSSIGSGGPGNVFLLFDLHTAGLLHYFEGPCIRLEIYGQTVLTAALSIIGFDSADWMFASADLGRSAWVNAFARENGTAVAFIRKTRSHVDGKSVTAVCEVIGVVANKTVIIYDDMTRTGGTLIHAAKAYRDAGARAVYVLVSHLALIGDAEIQAMIDSEDIRKIVATNSHPQTQAPLIQAHPEKFMIMDMSTCVRDNLKDILPKV